LEYKLEPGKDKSSKYKLVDYCNIITILSTNLILLRLSLPKYFKKINILKNSCKTYDALTNRINEKFNLNFHRKIIYYQVIKLREQENGKLGDDAKKIMEILKSDSENRNSFYKVQCVDNEFKGLSFMTKRMISVAKQFSDVFIIDTTHGTKNCFNLPLLDIAAINNLDKIFFIDTINYLGKTHHMLFLYFT